MPTFCRHNRVFADCPICTKGTVLDQSLQSAPKPRAPRANTQSKKPGVGRPTAARTVSGPYAKAGPYHDDDGLYEVRFERVPGGLRLAEWTGATLRRRAPVLAGEDLVPLVADAVERGGLGERDASALRDALAAESSNGAGASAGRAGDFRDELRVEALDDGRVRIARWLVRPGSGWELQDQPVMLPAQRFAEALRGYPS